MKIKKVKTEIYEFDLDEEIKRLKSCFKGQQLQRQMDIIDAMFNEKNIIKASDLINNLPYDEDEECHEGEYVGMWTAVFGNVGWGGGEMLKDSFSTYEY